MRLTTMTQITLDGVTQGNGGNRDEEVARNGFRRGGWARGMEDTATDAYIDACYTRADAFLFGRRTWELLARGLVDEMTLVTVPVILGQGARLFPDDGPDLALRLVDHRVDASGVTIQVFRPAGRPHYA